MLTKTRNTNEGTLPVPPPADKFDGNSNSYESALTETSSSDDNGSIASTPDASICGVEELKEEVQYSFNITPLLALLILISVSIFSFSVGTICRTALLSQDSIPTAIASSDESTNHACAGLQCSSFIESNSSCGVELEGKHNRRADQGSQSVKVREDVFSFPGGNHLLVDMKNIRSGLLDSEYSVAQAMIDLAQELELTLLSYHCHLDTQRRSGVSCIGILVEGRVSIHTWPTEGALLLDAFVSGNVSLLPIIPLIEKSFGIIPSHDISGELLLYQSIRWSHKQRGYRIGFDPSYNLHEDPHARDLGWDVLQNHQDYEMKMPLISTKTHFQNVDIYRLFEYRLHSTESYEESLHPMVLPPDKLLYLDGVEQSSLYGEAAYHEALVHPTMIAHPNPRRVAIIGGGEGATLREVLKHNTVEEVVMVEIDEELVNICREHLSEWSDCSDVEGSNAESCFEDSRATVIFADAFAYFIDHFGNPSSGDEVEEEKFDVIIMDALDPDQFVEIVGNLYKDNIFVDSLFNGLSKNGVFVVQIGEENELGDPPKEMGVDEDEEHMIDSLKNAGFESMHQYIEGHSHYDAPWSYLVSFKNYKSRARWYRNAAEIEVDLRQRIHSTKSRQPVLRFFDGSTMMSYQLPSKTQEVIYCRSVDAPWECDLAFNPHTKHSYYQLGDQGGGAEENIRRSQQSKDVHKEADTPIREDVNTFHILPSTWSLIDSMYLFSQNISSVLDFGEGYGYESLLLGEKHFVIASGMTAFRNGTSMDMKLDTKHTSDALTNRASVNSPVFERHFRQILAQSQLELETNIRMQG